MKRQDAIAMPDVFAGIDRKPRLPPNAFFNDLNQKMDNIKADANDGLNFLQQWEGEHRRQLDEMKMQAIPPRPQRPFSMNYTPTGPLDTGISVARMFGQIFG